MSLNVEIRQKLHDLIPEGAFVSRKWLLNQGFNLHTVDNLVKSNQLTLLRHGVYKRSFTNLSWQGIIWAFQKMYDFDVVIGGLTALEVQGYAHYIPMNQIRQIHLYSNRVMPVWINGLVEGIHFVFHLQSDLQGRRHSQIGLSKTLKEHIVKIPWRDGLDSIEFSNPERAILELLVEVPGKITFENAESILQGMISLSPKKLDELLIICDNLRIRRLFLWLAEKQNHPWFKKLHMENINLGSGNRVIVKGGVMNKKYKITVPKEYGEQYNIL